MKRCTWHESKPLIFIGSNSLQCDYWTGYWKTIWQISFANHIFAAYFIQFFFCFVLFVVVVVVVFFFFEREREREREREGKREREREREALKP